CWKYCVLALYSLPPWRSQARPHLHIPELGRMRRTASHPVTDYPNRRQPQTTAIPSSTTHVGLAVAATLIPTFAVFYRVHASWDHLNISAKPTSSASAAPRPSRLFR